MYLEVGECGRDSRRVVFWDVDEHRLDFRLGLECDDLGEVVHGVQGSFWGFTTKIFLFERSRTAKTRREKGGAEGLAPVVL